MNNKDQMHPEDMRNLIIFGVLSLLIWFVYDIFVLQPQSKALKEAKIAKTELIKNDPELLEPQKWVPRKEALAKTERVPFDNGEIIGSISLKGGIIDDLTLREYFETVEKKEHVNLFKPKETKESRFVNYGWVSKDKSLRLPNSSTPWSIQGNPLLTDESPITLVWDNGQGLKFERMISMDDRYLFKVTQKVYNNSGKDVTLHPYALISQKGVPEDHLRTWISHEGPMGFIGITLEQMYYAAMVKDPDKSLEAETGWIGISDKYWLTALIPPQNEMTKYRFKYTPDPVKPKERSDFQTDFTGPAHTIANGYIDESTYMLYAGPKKVLALKDYQDQLKVENFDLAVDFGWFWFLTFPLFITLHYLALWTGNVGVAIIIMTLILRSAVYPLTNKSYKSFAKMKVVAPQITELRTQYGDDKEKLQAEIVELYQREGVNPMSGCFPMLVQIPIFFCFYKVLFSTIEIRHAPFFGWIQDLSVKDPTNIFELFGLMPWDAPDFIHVGVWPCMMLVVMLFQKKLNPPPQDQLQKDLANYFPFMITFIMANFSSGLVIYWTFSGLFGMIQQGIIMHRMGVPIYLFNKDHFEEEMEKQIEEGIGVHPLMEMVEDEFEKGLFGDEGEKTEDLKPPKPKKKKKKK